MFIDQERPCIYQVILTSDIHNFQEDIFTDLSYQAISSYPACHLKMQQIN